MIIFFFFLSFSIKTLRERGRRTTDRNSRKTDFILCAVLALTSLCCLYSMNVLGKQLELYESNRMAFKYSKYVFAPKDREMTLGGYEVFIILSHFYTQFFHNRRVIFSLKKFISIKCFRRLHSLEMYNGLAISNNTLDALKCVFKQNVSKVKLLRN